MLVSIPTIFLLAASAAAQSTTTLCVAGQCLDGTSNISIGAVVSAAGSDSQFVLLPGAYPATTEPESLRSVLASGSSRLSYSPGFSPNGSSSTSQSISFPLTIALQPGVLSTTSSLFRGQTKFTAVPASSAALNETLGAKVPASGSLVMSPDVWASFMSGDKRIFLWDSVPDLAQLPSGLGQSEMTLVGLQSTKCTPACSGNGICTDAGICACPEGSGFTGSSCESCRDGFFGPQCLPCPEDCETCDGGATGTGKCLKPKAVGAPATCNCSNGVCDASGACACNEGWQDGSNGLKCSVCAAGFFKAADGSCQVCENGCERCQDNTGTCTTCSSGLVVDGNDGRKCVIDATGATRCPDGSFVNGQTCSLCSSACETCTGSGAGNCLRCARGTFKLNGQCVPTDAAGVCSGSKRVANTVKNTCDACPTSCSTCGITGFNAASSTFDQVQCTACIPGTYLSGGKCVAACPAGTFISKTDGFTCVACDTSCETCVDDAKFCLTCSGSSLANAGSCGATCPAGTFQSDGACLPCHADCASCTGPGFDQCTSCGAPRPALVASSTAAGSGGRCMPTCGKAQYLDATAGRCQSCDSACSSCAGAGPNQCLACAGDNQVLTGGSCAAAKCERGSSVIPGLGACLSALVAAPFVDNTPTESPTTPVPPTPPSSSGPRLVWWEILLMALGCAFIFLVILLLWRRRMRRKRAARTAQFAEGIKRRGIVARSVMWLGGIFSRRPAAKEQDVDTMVAQMRAQEMERHKHEMEMLEARSRTGTYVSQQQQYYDRAPYETEQERRTINRLSAPSMYSQVTGMPHTRPEPRMPVRNDDVPPMPREFRMSTISDGTSLMRSVSQRGEYPQAQQPRFYDTAPLQPRQHATAPLQPQRTGSSDSYRSGSSGDSERIRNPDNNPFRYQQQQQR